MRPWIIKSSLAGLLAFAAAWAVLRLTEAAVVRSISEPDTLRVYIGPCPYAWRLSSK
ncbi:MAG: hypothetical protein HC927_02095, partial [Deltaproteobacteria bacterium]|nr:hypothetical protein [Deltaproteobacteria bacterium]